MSREKNSFQTIFFSCCKTGLDNTHCMGYKKRERFVQQARLCRRPEAFPGHGGLYAYAIQLQKGDHRNGYF